MKDILEKHQVHLLVFIFIAFSFLAYLVNANRGIYADDDNLWFYSLSYKIWDPAGYEAVEDDLATAFQKDKASDEMMARLDDKRHYTYNYFFSSAIWSAARAMVFNLQTEETPYYKAVSDSIIYGFGLAFAVTLTILLIVLIRQKLPERFWYALALLAAFSALTCVLMTPKPPPFMIIDYPMEKMIVALLWFMSDPSFSFSAFSFTGRNNYVLFALAFFLVRWRGNFQLFYVLCALSLVMHASMAILALFIFIVIDALLRPSVFKNKTVIISILAGICYYLIVESLWKKVGFIALGAVVPVVALVVLGTIQDRVLGFFPKLQKFVHDVQARAQNNIMGWDILIFLTFWVLSIFPTVWISGLVDRTQFIYFWSQLHIRVLSIWQPALIFALFYWLIGDGKSNVYRGFTVLGGAGALALAATSNLYLTKQLHPYPVKIQETMRAVDAVASGEASIHSLSMSGGKSICYFPEGLVWYVSIQDYLARKAGSEEKPLEAYLSRKPKRLSLDCSRK